jgi:hypothetical protein
LDASFRIKRVFGGLLAFADVAARATAADAAKVDVSSSVTPYAPFRGALEEGARLALDAHLHRGGAPASIEVIALVELAADHEGGRREVRGRRRDVESTRALRRNDRHPADTERVADHPSLIRHQRSPAAVVAEHERG